MKKEYGELIKQAGTITALLTGAIVSCSFTNPLVNTVLGGVLTNILSNKMEQSKLLKLQEIFSKQNPANLNHNIEEITQEAIVWAIKNISFKYQTYCNTEDQKKILKRIDSELVQKINALDRFAWQSSEALLNQIDNIVDEKELIKELVSVDASWPIINVDFPYPAFFQDEFVSNFQLCFGELLKDKDNHEALKAYNRNISTQIQKSLVKQNEKIDQLFINSQHLKEEINRIARKPQEQFEKEIVFPEINIALDQYLKPLHENVQLLVDQNGEISIDINELKKETKHQTQRIEELGRKVDQNLNNKYFFILLPIFAISLSYFGYKYWQSTQPFIYTVAVQHKTVNTDLPKEEAEVKLSYGDKSEVQTTRDHEVIFKGLPSFLRGDSIKISASCFGFRTIDTQLVAKNILHLDLVRDDTYATMRGRVKDAETGLPIDSVLVYAQDIKALTDANGQYLLTFPESMQKEEQRLVVTKDGYEPWENIEPVIKNAESIIRLQKK